MHPNAVHRNPRTTNTGDRVNSHGSRPAIQDFPIISTTIAVDSMKRATLLCLTLFAFCFSMTIGWSQEIGYVEEFALAKDREAALKKLVPGTRDYYYYHCLHYQNTQQLDKVQPILDAWVKRFGYTDDVRSMQVRQALLNFSNDPESTYKFLQEQLELRFDHQREIPQAQQQLPKQLDRRLIATETLLQRALTRANNTQWLEPTGLLLLADQRMDRTRRRHLLSRLTFPDYPNLVRLVIEDLNERDSGGFGSLAIHRLLTLEQLDECAVARPELKNDSQFVNAYLLKLAPPADVNWMADRDAHRDYLDRLWEFASGLGPAFNSLKANVLFRRLDFDRHEGNYDRDRFFEYLKLPRQVFYVHPQLLRQVRSNDQIANLGADYRQTARIAPIYSDEELVRDYLHHFLVDATDYDEFKPLIREDYLRTQFATVKILNGMGDVERWASMLTPQQYQELLQRVDLDFALTNEEFFDDGDPVKIDLYTKNIDKLIVKVFEINTFNYYRKFQREIDTNISLDGLVPNSEQTFDYDNNPALRVRREFKFDDLSRPGVYVIDFIAGGKSSRALIRRGRLSALGQPTAAGQQFRVFDQNQQIVKDASLWIAGRNYEADQQGLITVPFSNQPGDHPAIIRRGDFCSLQTIYQPAETYSLTASLYVDREHLLRTEKAQLQIRPRLAVNSVPTAIGLLKEPKLTVTSETLDGIQATKIYEQVELSDIHETAVEFVVPPRLRTITLTLSGKVENISQNQEQPLSATQSWSINEIDTTDLIQDVHLVPTENGYWLEVRGKSGEIRPKQVVTLKLKHRDFVETVQVNLQSDENGRVQLGTLEDIQRIEVTLAGGAQHTWTLKEDGETRYASVHIPAGKTVEVPAPRDLTKVQATRVALLEVSQGQFLRDRSGFLRVEDGMVKAIGLGPGDYVLHLVRENETVNIRVTDGPIDQGLIIGKHRQLEIRNPRPLTIQETSVTDDSLVVQLKNPNDATRVHVIASRYFPAFSSFDEFAQIGDVEPLIFRPSLRRSVYLAGRTIGDELQYILDRKYARIFPGNMLDRPSLLLNPWDVRETDNQVEVLAEGDDFGRAGNEADRRAGRSRGKRQAESGNADFSNLDFLPTSSVLLANLKPDDQGRVVIARDQLGNRQHIRVVAVDPRTTTQRTVDLPASGFEPRDLRLAHAMPPNQHFCQTKQISPLMEGERLKLDDLVSAQFQYFDELSDVYRLFMALNPSSELREFEFLLTWSKKTDDEKQELYSKFASHELNFYLSKKDPEFFETVIRPHIAQKRRPQFMDQYLLGQDLSMYLEPWYFARLNVMEKILLAQRIEERSNDIVRSLDDLYLLEPTPRSVFDRYFDTGLAFDSLGWSGLDKSRALELGRQGLPQLGGGGGGRGGAQAGMAGLEGGEQFGGQAPTQSPQRQSRGAMANKAFAPPAAAAPSGRFQADNDSRGRDMAGTAILLAESATERKDLASEAIVANQDMGEMDELQDAQNFYMEQEATVEKLGRLREQSKALYRRLPATKEWIENNWYRLTPDQVTPQLVHTNRFWRDYAKHRGGTFLSPWFAEANRTRSEMLLALAVLDLPETAPEHDFDYQDSSLTVTARSPMIAMHQQAREVAFEPGNTTILVSENFFVKNDRYRFENGVRFDKFVDDEFLAHTLYGAQVVITNPTSTPRAIDLLVQIPQGAVFASGSRETRTIQMDLEAFSTKTFEYYFYFPTAGEFTHYPAHVSADEKVLAVAQNIPFRVVDRPAEIDRTSWQFVSQNGTEEEVLAFLSQQNLLRFDLSKIAFRMKNAAFFKKAIDILKNRYVYDHTLWSYGIFHRDRDIASEFLQHDDVAARVGPSFRSTLLNVDPEERNWYWHREYWPLVNARVHPVGQPRKILNPQIHQQYHELMSILAHHPTMSSDDHLVVTYYMLLQDRIEEALEHFQQVEDRDSDSDMAYAYCQAYLQMYLENPDEAEAIATKWAEYPVAHWQKRFRNIIAQVQEIRGGQSDIVDPRDNTQQQTALAGSEPSFDFELSDGKIVVHSQNVQKLIANFYEMDIELLFSRSPFSQDNLDGFSVIRPNASTTFELNGDEPSQTFELPDSMKNKNVLIELVAGDQVKSKPYFANQFNLQIVENYGQLKVALKETGKPLPKAYVKVYALAQDGSIRFHKDGYTDLRGRFDYVSQSNNPLDDVARYAVLVLHPEYGAVVRQAAPPAE